MGALAASVAAAISLGFASYAESAALNFPDAEIEPLAWSDFDGWAADDHATAFAAFRTSCKAVLKQRKAPPAQAVMHRELKNLCRRALRRPVRRAAAARAFFEANLRPLRIAKLGEAQGFLTGYYEPIAEGSRTPNGEYTAPMHRRPSDLVALDASSGADFPNKGRVGRKDGEGKIVDYFDRAAIEDGALRGRGLEICYLKDPIDAFFIHIQGSARIRLQEGGLLRINYDGHNGHRYTPVGRVLIERNIVPKDEMSMERIRRWMQANPEEGRELRRQNRSYVFFRVAPLSEHEEPIGAQGAPLSPGRSLAIDKALHAYGTPFWIEASLPITNEQPSTPVRRLMIAQDTGSAIVGVARADIYFGAGEEAGRIAGRIRHPGRFVMLAPRRVRVGLALKRIPLPLPRPAIPARAAKPGRGP